MGARPGTGKLVYKPFSGGEVVIKEGPFALLQYFKKQLKDDPSYAKGKLKLTY